jgi:LysM repeat protein
VVAVHGWSWRPLAGPAALLLAATVAVALARPAPRHEVPVPAAKHAAAAHAKRPAAPAAKTTAAPSSLYTVRAGDTLDAIARRTGVPLARLLELNPDAQPTSLFIGQRLRLR